MAIVSGSRLRTALRVARQALAIAAITLVLDYVATAVLFAHLKRAWSDADAANLNAYISVPYHHDLRPDQDTTRLWGNALYPWRTDRYGFRTGTCAPGEAEKDRPAVFVIGDSFTEALGSSYEQSFAGLLACDGARQGKAVWNLGVASYSPVIYHRKIRAAAERLNLRPADIFVFLDLSDIDDDANVYRVAQNDDIEYADHYSSLLPFDIGTFLVNNFATFRLIHDLYLTSRLIHDASLGRHRARWTTDAGLMQKWGQRGLEAASANLDKLVAICHEWQCRVTLVVYPWPDNVATGDRESIQVRHWQGWAAARGVRFIDGFAPFFREPADTAMRKYFIAGDVHFTELGNRLLYEAVKSALGNNW